MQSLAALVTVTVTVAVTVALVASPAVAGRARPCARELAEPAGRSVGTAFPGDSNVLGALRYRAEGRDESLLLADDLAERFHDYPGVEEAAHCLRHPGQPAPVVTRATYFWRSAPLLPSRMGNVPVRIDTVSWDGYPVVRVSLERLVQEPAFDQDWLTDVALFEYSTRRNGRVRERLAARDPGVVRRLRRLRTFHSSEIFPLRADVRVEVLRLAIALTEIAGRFTWSDLSLLPSTLRVFAPSQEPADDSSSPTADEVARALARLPRLLHLSLVGVPLEYEGLAACPATVESLRMDFSRNRATLSDLARLFGKLSRLRQLELSNADEDVLAMIPPSLRSLELFHSGYLRAGAARALRHLEHLGTYFTPVQWSDLASAGFTRLRSLTVVGGTENGEPLGAAFAAFLRSAHSLHSLEIHGEFGPDAFEGYGRSLEHLSLEQDHGETLSDSVAELLRRARDLKTLRLRQGQVGVALLRALPDELEAFVMENSQLVEDFAETLETLETLEETLASTLSRMRRLRTLKLDGRFRYAGFAEALPSSLVELGLPWMNSSSEDSLIRGLRKLPNLRGFTSHDTIPITPRVVAALPRGIVAFAPDGLDREQRAEWTRVFQRLPSLRDLRIPYGPPLTVPASVVPEDRSPMFRR